LHRRGHNARVGDNASGPTAANERGDKEEVRGGPGADRCFLNPDPNGIKMHSCEYLNGEKNPFPSEKYINTQDGAQKDMREEVNCFLQRTD
jgi:hypothetical protein